MTWSSVRGGPGRGVTFLVRHQAFVLLLLAAAALRALVWLSLFPATWRPDGELAFLAGPVRPAPDLWSPFGYRLFLLALAPGHSVALVTGAQHLLGLGVGVAGYVVLLRHGLPRWAATLAAVPVLADANLVAAGQVLGPDALFTALVLAGMLPLGAPGRLRGARVALGGFLLGLAAVTRGAGLPLVAVALVVLVARRAGLVRVGALLVAAAVPVGGYAAWYHDEYRRWGVSASGGLALYGRVSQFADCGLMNRLAPAVRALCPAEPLGGRRPVAFYLSDPRSPVWQVSADPTRRNELAARFARQAIVNQPGDYLRQSWHELAVLFSSADPGAGAYRLHRVALSPEALAALRAYQHGRVDLHQDRRGVDALLAYQHRARVPGVACLVALLAAAAGAVFGSARGRPGARGAAGALAGAALVLSLVPALTSQPDVRDRFATVPLLAIAGALGLSLLVRRASEFRRWPRPVGPVGPASRPAVAGPSALETTLPDLDVMDTVDLTTPPKDSSEEE